MARNLLREFFGTAPAIICTKETCVAAVNRVAACRPHFVSDGGKLSDFMSPFDTMRFFAVGDACRATEPLSFRLMNYYGFCAASASFERILGRRFAVVRLFESIGEAENSAHLMTEPQPSPDPIRREYASELLTVLTSMPLIPSEEYSGLIDLRTATERILGDVVRYGVLSGTGLKISENSEMLSCRCCPISVPLGSLMQMLSAMMAAAGDICAYRSIAVRLCRYGDQYEVRATVSADRLDSGIRDIDSLIDGVPSSAIYLALCSYVAGCCGCGFSAVRADDLGTVSLILSFDDSVCDAVDFKSRDFLYGYDEIFGITAAAVLSPAFNGRTAAGQE